MKTGRSFIFQRFILIIWVVYASSSCLLAQTPVITASRSDLVPRIDGKLDDPVWNTATPFSDFKMVEPTPGIAPTEKTELRVVYNQNGIYIGVRCFSNEPGDIVANTMEHDRTGGRNEDRLSILLDPFQDKRSAYIFIVNPKGAKSEGFATGENYTLGWDGLWEAKCQIDREGWTAEIFISFKTISFNPHLNSWGINIERYIARKQEVIRFSGINLNSFFSNPREAGLLEGIENIKQGLGLTFRPYTKVSRSNNKTDDLDPEKSLKGGFDIYKNITPNLVGAVTINTDFAETEVDARRLNLTRFPLYYPEKRTFFLEGSDIFEFGSAPASTFLPFFSRRIGLMEGRQVPLRWGAKMYGKIGNTNMSVLDVHSGTSDITIPTNMFAGRISQNIFDESKIGMIFTNGSQSGDPNTLAGADFRYKTSRFMGDNNFSVDLWGVKNWNDAKSGNKNGYGIKFDYPNDLIDVALKYNFFGDSINPGLGFLPRTGYHYLYTTGRYMPRPEKGWFGDLIRQWFFEFRFTNYWNLEGNLESRQTFFAPVIFRTESGEYFDFHITPNREVLPADFEVAEGVIIPKDDYRYVNYHIGANTASYRKFQCYLSYNFGGFYSGHYDNIQTGANLQLDGYVKLQVGANIVRGYLPEGDFSKNVYFSRINLFLTPDLGLSNYIQFDDISNRIGYNGRFFWQIRPGNILYLVYNNNIDRLFDPEQRFQMTEDEIIFKIQISLRI